MTVMLLKDIEKMGLDALNEGNYELAINCFRKIIDIQPNYEHGGCYYHLACLYEDIGELSLAKNSYEKALEYMPDDEIYFGGYASFLYLHGSLEDAFSAYLKLLKLENSRGRNVARTLEGLNSLAEKIGLSHEQLCAKINEIIQ